MTKDAQKLLRHIIDGAKSQNSATVEIDISKIDNIPNIGFAQKKLLNELETAGVISGYQANILGEVFVYLTSDGLEYFDDLRENKKSSNIVFNVSGGQVNIANDRGSVNAVINNELCEKDTVLESEYKENKKVSLSSNQKAEKVFISYSWTPDYNKKWVERLVHRLEADGIGVVIDFKDLKLGHDKYAFMERTVNDNTIKKVLIICNRTYKEKADGRIGGVGDESAIITSQMYGNVRQEKFIPVVNEYDENGQPFLPNYLASRMYADLTNFEVGYKELLYNIRMELNNDSTLNIFSEQDNFTMGNAKVEANQNRGMQKMGIQSNIITCRQDITFTNNFVGRENEIDEILEKLKESTRILVSGMGGIGKTTILKKLYHTIVELNKNENKKIGYFEYKLSMADTICNALEFDKTGDRNIDLQKAQKILEDYANYSEMIIFIDNIPTDRYSELQQLNSIKGKIVITSRQNEYENYDTVFIDKMSVEECKEIFEKESGLHSNSHDLEYIVNTLIGRHTLTVRLLAKIAKKKQLTIKQLKNKLLEVGFKINYKDLGETTNILTEYEKLYSISGLNKQQRNILEGFSLLREAKLDIDKYQMFLAQDVNDLESDELYELYDKGWLEKDGDKFSIHPVFAEFISESEEISIYRHKQLCNKIKSLCSNVDDSAILSKQDYLAELISFGKNIHIDNQIEKVLYCVARIVKHFAMYNSAIDIFKRIRKDNIELYISAQLSLAESYMNVSYFGKAKECFENLSVLCIRGICDDKTYIEYIIYYSLYLEKSSRNNLEKESAIRIMEGILGLNMDEMTKARVYNCLGGFYSNLRRDCDDLNNSLYYLTESLNIREKNDLNITDLSRTYNNLGMVYFYKFQYSDKEENLQNAEKYFEKSLMLRKKIFDNDHPDIARVMVNLGNVYIYQGNYEKALQYMKWGLEKRKKVLGEFTKEVGITYNNMVNVYVGLNDKENAYACAAKAQQIYLRLFGEDSNEYRNICKSHKLKLR